MLTSVTLKSIYIYYTHTINILLNIYVVKYVYKNILYLGIDKCMLYIVIYI